MSTCNAQPIMCCLNLQCRTGMEGRACCYIDVETKVPQHASQCHVIKKPDSTLTHALTDGLGASTGAGVGSAVTASWLCASAAGSVCPVSSSWNASFMSFLTSVLQTGQKARPVMKTLGPACFHEIQCTVSTAGPDWYGRYNAQS